MMLFINLKNTDKNDFYALQEELSKKWAGKNVSIYPGILRIDNEDGTALACNAIDVDEANEFDFEISKKQSPERSLYPISVLTSACTATCINSYIIGSKGEIYKCWNDVGNQKRVIGNIAEDDLTNPALLYRYIAGSKWFHDEECKKCFYLPICSGKCAWYVLRNKYENGKYNVCQCMQKTPDMLNKCLEEYYYNKNVVV